MILKDQEAKDWLLAHSPYFSFNELKCKCGCGTIRIDTDHIAKLNLLRLNMGVPLKISSGYRCPTHNASVGGVANSSHTVPTTPDERMGTDIITIEDEFRERLAKEAEPIFGGIIIYNKRKFIHLDNRPMELKFRRSDQDV